MLKQPVILPLKRQRQTEPLLSLLFGEVDFKRVKTSGVVWGLGKRSSRAGGAGTGGGCRDRQSAKRWEIEEWRGEALWSLAEVSAEEERQRAAKKTANKACAQFPIVAQERERERDRRGEKDRRRKKSQVDWARPRWREILAESEREREERRRRERERMKMKWRETDKTRMLKGFQSGAVWGVFSSPMLKQLVLNPF